MEKCKDNCKDELVVGILAVGLDSALLEMVGLTSSKSLRIDHVGCDVDRLMDGGTEVPAFVVCGVPPEGVSVVEVAQVVRMQYPRAPIYLVVPAGARFDRKNLVKNGFSDVFFLPLDRVSATNAIADEIIRVRKRGRIYRPVRVVDLTSEQVLDFDTYVYFPVNDKHVCYSTSGSTMAPERVERLKQHKMSSLFVSEEELPKFYEYTARALKDLGKSGTMSETERGERLHKSVRDLISGLFTDSATGTEGGKKIVEDCQHIVKNYVADKDKGNWYARLLAAAGGNSDTYSHAASVSTYAALFGIALGLPTVEDLALAGLLHDIGLAKVDVGASEIEQQKHTEYSIEMIRDRKLVVSQLVYQMIQQHHERFDGTGYPKRLQGNRICVEAQVLALADQFADLMEVKPGQPTRDVLEAIAELRRTTANDPSRVAIDPSLFKRILALFPETESRAAA